MLDHGHKLKPDAIVVVKGRLDGREDEPKLMGMDIQVIEVIQDGAPPIRVSVPAAGLSEVMVAKLKDVLLRYPGQSQVFLHVGVAAGDGGGKVLRLPDKFCVDASSPLFAELSVLLGPDAIVG